MGEQSESCLTEMWCDFKVNGVKAWGAAEWQCRNEKSCRMRNQEKGEIIL